MVNKRDLGMLLGGVVVAFTLSGCDDDKYSNALKQSVQGAAPVVVERPTTERDYSLAVVNSRHLTENPVGVDSMWKSEETERRVIRDAHQANTARIIGETFNETRSTFGNWITGGRRKININDNPYSATVRADIENRNQDYHVGAGIFVGNTAATIYVMNEVDKAFESDEKPAVKQAKGGSQTSPITHTPVKPPVTHQPPVNPPVVNPTISTGSSDVVTYVPVTSGQTLPATGTSTGLWKP